MTPQDDWVRLSLSIDVHSARGIAQLMQLSVSHLAMFVASLLNIEASHFALYLSQTARLEVEQSELAQQRRIRFGENLMASCSNQRFIHEEPPR